MKKLISIFAPWLPLSAAIVFVFGFLYIAVQQSIRTSANDLPRQYALDIKTRLESGTPHRRSYKSDTGHRHAKKHRSIRHHLQ